MTAAEELASRINKLKLNLTLETGETGKAFGSITAKDLTERLQAELKDITLPRHAVELEKGIKETGDHEIPVRLHPDVTAKLRVKVSASTPEGDEACGRGSDPQEENCQRLTPHACRFSGQSAGESPQFDGELKSGKRPRKGNYPQTRAGYLPDIHRSLPQSLDAEKGVLCSALLSPGNVLGECIERLEENHFYHPAHQIHLPGDDRASERGQAGRFHHAHSGSKGQGRTRQSRGRGRDLRVIHFCPDRQQRGLLYRYRPREIPSSQLIQTCTEFAGRAYDEQGEVKVLLDEAESKVMQIGEERFKGVFADMRTEVMKAIESIEMLYKNRGGLTGMPTGFKKLDEMTGGLRGSEMFVVAARPSMGKTAFAMNIAEHVAVNVGKPGRRVQPGNERQPARPAIALLPRPSEPEARARRISLHARHEQDHEKRPGSRQEQHFHRRQRPASASSSCARKPAECRDRHGIELVVIDYLQLLRSTSKRGQDNRQIEISEISNGIKALAKELDIPIIVLAQLNRNPDSRTGASKGRPRMSDLRESGSIEQDADVVSLLVRSEVYEDDEDEKKEKAGEAELIIAKQRTVRSATCR